MTLLEVNVEGFKLLGSPVADWVMAIGAIVAIIASIIGFRQLYRDNKNKENQINSLTALAQESKNQTEHLSSQVDQMIQGNKLQTEYISLFQRYVATNEKSLEYQSELKILEMKKRKKEIMPKLSFSFSNQNPQLMKVSFTNRGGIAKITSCEKLQRNSMNSNLDFFKNREILNNEIIEIEFTPAPFGLATNQCSIEQKIITEDVDGNQYYQIIENSKGNISIGKPEEIIS